MANDNMTTTIERLFELWNEHDGAGMTEVYSSEARVRDSADPDNAASGHEAIIARAQMILGGFSDARLELVSSLFDGDRACTEWHFSGTHDGEFLGVPATGQATDNLGASVVQFGQDGRIVQETAYWDVARFLRQTGVLPAVADDAAVS
jgi:steroid delta-isomerase-like uncharacterized protein